MNREPIKYFPIKSDSEKRKAEISAWLMEAMCMGLCVVGIILALIFL